MQRYLAQFPAAGEIILFDRSWYNRAGVERVMGFCTDEQYERFLELAPVVEREMIVKNGIILRKYFLDVSQDGAFRPGWTLRLRAAASGLAYQAMPLTAKPCSSAASTSTRAPPSMPTPKPASISESPELAEKLTAYMATGVVPANSYRVLLDPNGEIVWETVRNGQRVRYRDEPETGIRRRFVADLLKLLPINSQL